MVMGMSGRVIREKPDRRVEGKRKHKKQRSKSTLKAGKLDIWKQQKR